MNDGGGRPEAAGSSRVESTLPAGELVELDEVRDAARRLGGVSRVTPLLPGRLPGGEDLWLKCENLQHGGAFKVRGAYNFVSRLSDGERSAGLVTYSSGNHAQGVARAAREFGIRAVIVMPVDAPSTKVAGTRRLGGEVVLEGTTTTERRERAEAVAQETGATIVPPFDHRWVIAGQGTVALETVRQLEEAAAGGGMEATGRPGLVLVPIGGGGLLSGHAAVLAALAPGCRLVGVEPEGAASMKRSLEAGEPVTLEHVETVADGLKPVRPGDLTFRHVRELVDEVVTVSEPALREAVLWCFERRLVVEPSGAATVAALLSGAGDGSGVEDDVVAVLSGGNVDPGILAQWLKELQQETEQELGG